MNWQEQSESDDEFKLHDADDDDDGPSDATSKATNENTYVPLKERRRQHVSDWFHWKLSIFGMF